MSEAIASSLRVTDDEAIASLIGLRNGRIDVVGACVWMLRVGYTGDVLRDQMLTADNAFRAVCGTQKMRDSIDAMVDERLAALSAAARA